MGSSIAIMQPYFFPYIGYFQLINAVDEFVFYDDVNFITRGWIHRNKILINGEAKYISVPCKDASQNRLIYQTKHALDDRNKKKLLKKIRFTYSNAPYFDGVFDLVAQVLTARTEFIAELAIESVQCTSEYLCLDTGFLKSSEHFTNQSLDAADRLIDISKKRNFKRYINPIGGEELYNKRYFMERGVELLFLKPSIREYEQFGKSFVPGLSIIDVMMFNSPETIKWSLLTSYDLR